MVIRQVVARKRQQQLIFSLREGMQCRPIPPKQRNHCSTLVTTLLRKQSTLPHRYLFPWRRQVSMHSTETWDQTPQEMNKIADIENERGGGETSVRSSQKSSLKSPPIFMFRDQRTALGPTNKACNKANHTPSQGNTVYHTSNLSLWWHSPPQDDGCHTNHAKLNNVGNKSSVNGGT